MCVIILNCYLQYMFTQNFNKKKTQCLSLKTKANISINARLIMDNNCKVVLGVADSFV